MRKKLLYPLLASCLFACSDKDTSYEVVKNDLRAPAYPLVTIDPYASAWFPVKKTQHTASATVPNCARTS